MKRRSRIRFVLRWTGVAAIVAFAYLWWWSTEHVLKYRGDNYQFQIMSGAFSVRPQLLPRDCIGKRLRIADHNWPGTTWRPGFRYRKKLTVGGLIWAIYIPMWLVISAIAPPVAFSFWRDRKPRVGHCIECSYNLTGTMSGSCPECGKPIDSTTTH